MTPFGVDTHWPELKQNMNYFYISTTSVSTTLCHRKWQCALPTKMHVQKKHSKNQKKKSFLLKHTIRNREVRLFIAYNNNNSSSNNTQLLTKWQR